MLPNAVVLLLCLGWGSIVSAGVASGSVYNDDPEPPVWPEMYTASFKFFVPYVKEYQREGLEYDMQFHRDSARGLQLIQRSGSEVWIEHAAQDMRWYIQPGNLSQPGCIAETMSAGGGPSRRLLDDAAGKPAFANESVANLLSPALPPIHGSAWSFAGHETITLRDGSSHVCHLWQYHVEVDKNYGQVDLDWKFYVSTSGAPVRLEMHGLNWFSGGHWDHYVADFYAYKAHAEFDDTLFAVPSICDGVNPAPPDLPPILGGAHLTSRLHSAMAGMLLPKHSGDSAYDAHCMVHGRTHAHAAEYTARKDIFHANRAAIEAHNGRRNEDTDGAGYEQALNQFADWTQEEWRALVSGSKRHREVETKNWRLYKPSLPLHMLPPSVDWRGSGADSVIKDQAMCGSCWSFAAVSPLETAYFRHYGELQLLSEQYVMDCSWPYGNTGCNGGFQDPALDFVIDNGGIPAAQDYHYVGVNSACRNDTPLAAAFSHFVKLPPYNATVLKEALLTQGPMAVSISADDPGFQFYKRGIFYSPKCVNKPMSELDHAVMISGYGRDPASGRTFWLIKNIWSTYWGEGGYMRVDMDRNDCGISAQGEFAVLDVAATDALRAER